MNTWEKFIQSEYMICTSKKKIEYFHNPWIKILLKLFSLNNSYIFNNWISQIVTFKLKGNVNMKIHNKNHF